MSNGIENWMQDWLKLLSLSMPLKGWNLVLALRLVIVKAAKLWMKFSGLKEDGYTRRTNNLGGFEGGMTNGQPSLFVGL